MDNSRYFEYLALVNMVIVVIQLNYTPHATLLEQDSCGEQECYGTLHCDFRRLKISIYDT